MAGTTLDGLNFAEVHDCFTIAELIMYEVMGLIPSGEGRRSFEEGWVYRDGKLPDARRAAVHNMGGLAIANYVSVLEEV